MAPRLERKLAIAVLLGVLTPSCMDCDSDYTYPSYRIVVVNSATREGVCDAEVSVVGENTGRQPARGQSNCTYVADIPNESVVTIEVTRDGFAPAMKTVSTSHETDECGKAIFRDVQVDIEPL